MYQYIYISTTGNNQIEVWRIEKNGKLELIQIVNLEGQAQPIHIFKKKKILYIGLRPNFKIIYYKISECGILKEINNFKIKESINYITIYKEKKILIYCSYHSGSLTAIKLNCFGYPKKVIKNIYFLEGCHSCVLDKNKKILFATALKKDKIYLYNFNNDEIVSNENQKYVKTNHKSGPRHIICHKNKINLYSINELDGTIDVWSINYFNNTIIHLQKISLIPTNFIGVPWASEIRISPSGRYLYSSDRNSNVISVFTINKSNGLLFCIQKINTELQPRSFDIDAYGKYLVVAGEKSNCMSIYKISSFTGFLTFIKQYTIGKNPLWLSIN